ncbi:hypothetical protein PMG11_01276 [Penicillium brasilianum]|uniref:DNA2/NAM7 helicase helicase domain-containing protein n=1 Tax=Penicillium brasilianum TaxID=104259 RepID=A0A0F7TGJ6_PENBI|nr:hypothetical protein PMG11_01276 [Penicillium brasilianum]
MARKKRPLSPSTEPANENVGQPDLHQELVGPRPRRIPSVLITDDASVLTCTPTRDHSFIACSFALDASYPDPYLEVSFECAYHDPIPPPDPLDDPQAESGHVDKKQDAQGYRNTHHGCAKFTSSDIASLRIVQLEAPNNENKELQNLTFADAMARGDRSIAPQNLVDGNRILKLALDEGNLKILRIELHEDVTIKTIGLHTPKVLGEQNASWLELCQHHKSSRSFNLAVDSTYEGLEAMRSQIVSSWEEMRQSPGPFHEFYGNHPDKPFVKSGSADDNVPRTSRRNDFDAPGQLGFMHKHEYNALCAYGYIDEHAYNDSATRELTGRPLELRLMEVPHTEGREFMAFVSEANVASARLQPGDPLEYAFVDGDSADAGSQPDGHDRMEGIHSSDPYERPLAQEELDREEEVDFMDSVHDDDPRERNLAILKFIDEKRTAKQSEPQTPPQTTEPIYWTGKVGNDAAWIPTGWRLLYMVRPYDRDAKAWDFKEEINALPWRTMADPDFKTKFLAHPPHHVCLGIIISEKEKKSILAANHEMYMKGGQMEELWDLLLMQEPSTFRHVDFYGTIQEDTFDFAQITNRMNHGQKAAFAALRDMRAFAVALHGPPGTGKTFWASNVLIPLIQQPNKDTGQPHLIYAMAATNDQVDKLAEELHKVLNQIRKSLVVFV